MTFVQGIFSITILFYCFTSRAFLATMFWISDYCPSSFSYSITTGPRTRRPSAPRRPHTIHWKNKWKFLQIHSYANIVFFYTWALLSNTGSFWFALANTFLATIFGSCGFSPLSNTKSISTRLRACWPRTPFWPKTIH